MSNNTSETKQQDAFMNDLRKVGATVEVGLCSGQKLVGVIKGFDRYTILLATGKQSNVLVFKHALATMVQKGGSAQPDALIADAPATPAIPERKTRKDVVVPAGVLSAQTREIQADKARKANPRPRRKPETKKPAAQKAETKK